MCVKSYTNKSNISYINVRIKYVPNHVKIYQRGVCLQDKIVEAVLEMDMGHGRAQLYMYI